MIISRTPLRISLVGGGTDFPSFYEKESGVPGCVVSFAINKYVYVILNKRFDKGFRISYSQTENVETLDEIHHDIIREAIRLVRRAGEGLEVVTVADVSGHGTGLGSSSSLSVGLIKALNAYIEGPLEDPGALAEIGFIVEAQKCHHKVGKQDHYAAAYGGFNRILFKKGLAQVDKIDSQWDGENPWCLADLPENLLLLWTGQTRQASTILDAQSKAMGADKYAIGKEMAELAHHFAQVLQTTPNIAYSIGQYLHLNWALKKKLNSNISDPQIDMWYDLAMNNGALGGKLCGAGGGGFLLFAAPQNEHARITRALGLEPMKFKIAQQGSEIIYDDQNFNR